MTSQNREALKLALRNLWPDDPEIKDLIKNGNTVNAIRARLKAKTAELFK